MGASSRGTGRRSSGNARAYFHDDTFRIRPRSSPKRSAHAVDANREEAAGVYARSGVVVCLGKDLPPSAKECRVERVQPRATKSKPSQRANNRRARSFNRPCHGSRSAAARVSTREANDAS